MNRCEQCRYFNARKYHRGIVEGKGNMDRLTSYEGDYKREMICRYEDCDTCEEYCPDLNADNCPCLQEILEKLAEYEDLEEQGKLPKVAVGDTVYRVHEGTKLSPDRVYECKVVGVKQEYNTLSVKLHANINEETYSIWIDDWFDKCQIGHEFFLTQEAAEAALKEMSE